MKPKKEDKKTPRKVRYRKRDKSTEETGWNGSRSQPVTRNNNRNYTNTGGKKYQNRSPVQQIRGSTDKDAGEIKHRGTPGSNLDLKYKVRAPRISRRHKSYKVYALNEAVLGISGTKGK